MLSKIMMPSGGQTTNESLITRWLKKVGDLVERGDVLFEIETDKATLEVESYAKGVLKATYFKEGETASTGDIVAYVGNADDQLPNSNSKIEHVEEIVINDIKEVVSVEEEKKTNKVFETVEKTQASPKARKASKEKNVDIDELYLKLNRPVKFTDVDEFSKPEPIFETSDYYFIDTTPMRKAIATKMSQSKLNAPQYTVSVDIDMRNIIEFRNNINKYVSSKSVKISFNDMIMKAATFAIKKFPLINATYGDNKIKIYNAVNFGLAVSIDGGLVVPVIDDVETKTLSQIATKRNFVIENVKSSKLDKNLLSGGTITLSNLGMLGVKKFTAILNYPESCILAVSAITDVLYLENGEVKSKSVMDITATFDHRLIDGSYGAEFLAELKTFLENPQLLVL